MDITPEIVKLFKGGGGANYYGKINIQLYLVGNYSKFQA